MKKAIPKNVSNDVTIAQFKWAFLAVDSHRLELQPTEPKSAVLPLHHESI